MYRIRRRQLWGSTATSISNLVRKRAAKVFVDVKASAWHVAWCWRRTPMSGRGVDDRGEESTQTRSPFNKKSTTWGRVVKSSVSMQDNREESLLTDLNSTTWGRVLKSSVSMQAHWEDSLLTDLKISEHVSLTFWARIAVLYWCFASRLGKILCWLTLRYQSLWGWIFEPG